jgi:fluoride exporter
MLTSILLVGIGGSLGAISRYGLGLCFTHTLSNTLVVNLAGCLMVGMIAAVASTHGPLSLQLRLCFVTGFLGSFTTFSAYAWTGFNLFKDGHYLSTIAYLGCQVIAGLAMVALGDWMVRQLWPGG